MLWPEAVSTMTQPWKQWMTETECVFVPTSRLTFIAPPAELYHAGGLELYVYLLPFVRQCYPETRSLCFVRSSFMQLCNAASWSVDRVSFEAKKE